MLVLGGLGTLRQNIVTLHLADDGQTVDQMLGVVCHHLSVLFGKLRLVCGTLGFGLILFVPFFLGIGHKIAPVLNLFPLEQGYCTASCRKYAYIYSLTHPAEKVKAMLSKKSGKSCRILRIDKPCFSPPAPLVPSSPRPSRQCCCGAWRRRAGR